MSHICTRFGEGAKELWVTTVYKPGWPQWGFRDQHGRLRLGIQWDELTVSRPLTEHEILRVEEVA